MRFAVGWPIPRAWHRHHIDCKPKLHHMPPVTGPAKQLSAYLHTDDEDCIFCFAKQQQQ